MLLLLACATPDDSGAPEPVDYTEPGPYAATRHLTTLTDPVTTRTFPVQVWAPAAPPAADPAPMDTLVADPDDAATFATLLAAAPADCPARSTTAGLDAAPASGGPWPLVMMSHCHGCTAFSTTTVAAHLATRGYVVVAPEHVGDTLWDSLAGALLPLDADTLALREADLATALDAALAGDLGVAVDPARVGAFGHSFGAVTAGKLLQDRLGGEGAPRAAMFVGAPPDNPLLPGVDAEALAAPVLFFRLLEDHSVGAAGNLLMAGNYAAVPGPAWQLDMADAGHWSPSDLAGLTEDLMPGCGEDTREATAEPFEYLDPARGRTLTAGTAAAFFAHTLDGEDAGAAWLAAPPAEIGATSR